MSQKIKGYWESRQGFIKLTLIIEKTPKDFVMTFSNQMGLVGSISVEALKRRAIYIISILEGGIASDYIIVSGVLINQIHQNDPKSKLTLDINQQIGKAVISFSTSVLNQIDGLLASI